MAGFESRAASRLLQNLKSVELPRLEPKCLDLEAFVMPVMIQSLR
jgi:hypothetical protein